MWFFVVLLTVLAAGCLLVARWPRTQVARRARGNAFAVKFKMYVAPADMVRFDTTLDRRSAARWLSAAASFGVAALAVALVAGVRRHGFDLFGPSLYLGIISTAWIAGLLGEVAPRVRAQSAARAARLRSPGVSDFLHPVLRGYLALLALIGVLALVPGVRPPLLAQLPTVAALFPAIVFLGCELFARLVVTLPQPAVDPGELYLADTLRADALWNAYHWGTIFTATLLVLPFVTEMQETTAGTILSLLLFDGGVWPFPRSSTSAPAGPTCASASACGPSFRAPPWSPPPPEQRHDHRRLERPPSRRTNRCASRSAHRWRRATLAPGTKLPTVRRLAGDLGLATNTVARAYRELEALGRDRDPRPGRQRGDRRRGRPGGSGGRAPVRVHRAAAGTGGNRSGRAGTTGLRAEHDAQNLNPRVSV